MIDLVKNNIKDLKDICEKHQVKSLYLFGSAAKNKFNFEYSDLDFVVDFNPSVNPLYYADNFFSLLENLEGLFGKDVDLVSSRALKNQIMISEIDDSKVQLYAA